MEIQYLKNFIQHIGGGTFGDIYGSKTKPDEVLKAIKDVNRCNKADDEYKMHRKIYKKFQRVKTIFPNVLIPQPIVYFRKDYYKYKCFYSMKRIYSPVNPPTQLIHLTFNYDSDFDSKYTKFVPINKFKQIFNERKFENVIKIMGYAFALLVIGVNIDASDVEFVLAKGPLLKTKIAVIDYGYCRFLPKDPRKAAISLIKNFFEFHNLYVPYDNIDNIPYLLLFMNAFIRGAERLPLDNRELLIMEYLYLLVLEKIRITMLILELKNNFFSGIKFERHLNDENMIKILDYFWDVDKSIRIGFKNSMSTLNNPDFVESLIRKDIKNINQEFLVSKKIPNMTKRLIQIYIEGLHKSIRKMVFKKFASFQNNKIRLRGEIMKIIRLESDQREYFLYSDIESGDIESGRGDEFSFE